MSIQELVDAYMAQSGNTYGTSDHDAHSNGSTHTNSSGHHADSKQPDGSGHGDHYDLSADY